VIFIIDDDKYVLRGFQILLESADLESMVYSSVEEFLEAWDQNQNDTLILDIHMPGLNGCDLLKYMEEMRIHLPVVVITAYDEDENRQQALNYGALAYLIKPVDGGVLLDLLKKKPLTTKS
jgi:two-component system, LuxR family, response regulator FixJ